jgi:hypothetical protein
MSPQRSRGLCLLLLLLVAMPLAGGVKRAEPAGEEEDFLRRLEQTYGKLTSVHLSSRFTMTIYRGEDGEVLGEPVVGSGEFEYWAEGTKYRFRYEVDPQLELLASNEVAYDGQTYQRYLVADDVLALHTGDKDQVPAAVPNPFFLPLNFLTRETEDCPFCILKLSHLSEPAVWDDAMGKLSSASGPPGLLVLSSGDRGEPGRFELRFERSEEGAPRITKLVRLAPSGDEMRATFSRYAAARGPGLKAEFPMLMDVDFPSHDGSDVGMGELRIVVTGLEINQPIDDARFRLDRETVRHIWDEDGERWVKHPSSELVEGGR